MTIFSQDIAIEITALKKKYKIYSRPIDFLFEFLTRITKHKEFWPLKSIDLKLNRGEILGVVGRNGAGKSTLLKIISGVMEKTEGSVNINGKVTAILELGSGFHPEYTGRENVFMGGICLGMSKREILNKMDSIIEFSELEDCIDQPFRTYSSGMKARLTFATAVSVDPDILIIDEALSVGDAKFQYKSFSKMRQFKEQGKTILLVSHDMNAITSFCDRALLLDDGKIIQEGQPKHISETYHKMLFGGVDSKKKIMSNLQKNNEDSDFSNLLRYGDKSCEIVDFGLYDNDGEKKNIFLTEDVFKFSMKLDCNKEIFQPSMGIVIRNVKGIDVFGVTSDSIKYPMSAMCPGSKYEFSVNMHLRLAPGDYFITFGVAHAQSEKADFIESGIHFTVQGNNGLFLSSIVDMNPELSFNQI